MANIISYSGQQEVLNRFVGKKSTTNLYFHLYSDDRTPAITDEVSSFTEITDGSYAALEILPEEWTVSIVGGEVQIQSNVKTFVFTGNIPRINGYYITNAAGDVLIHAERFQDAPIKNYNEGSLELQVTLSFGIEV